MSPIRPFGVGLCLAAVLAGGSPAAAESVSQAWFQNFGDLLGQGNDVALDAQGDVYVTGWSENAHPGIGGGSNLNANFTTLRYSPAGALVWSALYSENGISDDQAAGLALDGSGNVYVAGFASMKQQFLEYRFATVSYTSNGTERWVRQYRAAENAFLERRDDIAVAANGNVYVTGRSFENVGQTNNDDIVTIQYDANGTQQWIARFSGPLGHDAPDALAVDAAGNVYVTGVRTGFGTSSDWVTIKYDPQGVEQWASIHSGPGSSLDEPQAIAVDGVGNVYVAGTTGSFPLAMTTIKYNANGETVWVRNTPGVGVDMSLTPAGKVLVSGRRFVLGQGEDFLTVQYDANGVQEWATSFNNTASNGSDFPRDLSVDDQGNAYITGHTTNPGFGEDIVTVKYDSTGVQRWVATFSGVIAGDPTTRDRGHAVAVRSGALGLGNVYVTGFSESQTGGRGQITTLGYTQQP